MKKLTVLAGMIGIFFYHAWSVPEGPVKGHTMAASAPIPPLPLKRPAQATSKTSEKSTSNSITPPASPAQVPYGHEGINYWKQTLEKILAPGHKSRQDILGHLSRLGLNPYQTVDSYPGAGSLTIIRTQGRPVGSRYFHAQVFHDESGTETLQHLSLEFKPGERTFAEVARLLGGIAGSETPEVDRKDYKLWRHGEYIIWMKVLDEKDLQDTHFNAYSQDDIGTIRMAMELEIHG